MATKRFHITWFIDTKKTILAGTTVEAKDITEAVNVLCDMRIQLFNGSIVNSELIKYVMEL
jgi:hypothetical protein